LGHSELDELLARYPRSVQPLDTPAFLGGAGGLSGARLWRYRSGAGPLVARCWPAHGPGKAHIERVHSWLSLSGALGFVPAPIADLAGQTLQELRGRIWEVTPWMAGAPEHSSPPAQARLRSAFAALAAFHQCLASGPSDGVSPGLEERLRAVARLIDGGLDRLERSIERTFGCDEAELREGGLRWASLARAEAPRLLEVLRAGARCEVPLQPCLRDARPDHFLFDGDRLCGLVDFGAMGVDCVSGDIARLVCEWLDGDQELKGLALDAYERVRRLTASEAALVWTFEWAAALLIGEHWIRWHFVEGRTFEDPAAVASGIARSARALARLAQRSASP
jgi:homoserine kinase type II